MALANDNRDVLYIDEYGETTMIHASFASRLFERTMADLPFTQRYHHIDDLPPALIESIILRLLEDVDRLAVDPDATLRINGPCAGFTPENEAVAPSEGAMRDATRHRRSLDDQTRSPDGIAAIDSSNWITVANGAAHSGAQ